MTVNISTCSPKEYHRHRRRHHNRSRRHRRCQKSCRYRFCRHHRHRRNCHRFKMNPS